MSTTIKQLRYSELMVDRDVQRALNETQAAQISENFRPEAVGTLVVSHRDNGDYHVMDGQTRRAGAIGAGRGDDLVDCKIHEGLSRAEEAAMFRLLNDRRSVGPIDKFLVRVVEGDPVAVQINTILNRAGWTVAFSRNRGKCQAVGAMEKVWNWGGKAGDDAFARSVTTTLVEAVTEAWGHDPDAMRSEIIEGLGLLLASHRHDMDRPKLVREMSQYEGGPLALIGRGRGLRDMRGGRVADNMADVLVNLHNKQKRTGRLPGWRSE